MLNRCLFKINPENGTRVERKEYKQKQHSIKIKVHSLITNVADFEWRELKHTVMYTRTHITGRFL